MPKFDREGNRIYSKVEIWWARQTFRDIETEAKVLGSEYERAAQPLFPGLGGQLDGVFGWHSESFKQQAEILSHELQVRPSIGGQVMGEVGRKAAGYVWGQFGQGLLNALDSAFTKPVDVFDIQGKKARQVAAAQKAAEDAAYARAERLAAAQKAAADAETVASQYRIVQQREYATYAAWMAAGMPSQQADQSGGYSNVVDVQGTVSTEPESGAGGKKKRRGLGGLPGGDLLGKVIGFATRGRKGGK